jgi:hypothetical protein
MTPDVEALNRIAEALESLTWNVAGLAGGIGLMWGATMALWIQARRKDRRQ